MGCGGRAALAGEVAVASGVTIGTGGCSKKEMLEML